MHLLKAFYIHTATKPLINAFKKITINKEELLPILAMTIHNFQLYFLQSQHARVTQHKNKKDTKHFIYIYIYISGTYFNTKTILQTFASNILDINI